MKIKSSDSTSKKHTTPIKKSIKCPHGALYKACPICAGRAGGAAAFGNKFTAGQLRLLTWADLLPGVIAKNRAKWIRLQEQLQKQKKLDESKLIEQNTINLNQKELLLLQNQNSFQINTFYKVLAFLRSKIIKLGNLKNKVLNSLKQTFNQRLKIIFKNALSLLNKNIFKNIKSTFIDISGKIASIYGEQEKILKYFWQKNITKKLKKKFSGLIAMIDFSMKQGKQRDQKNRQKQNKKTPKKNE